MNLTYTQHTAGEYIDGEQRCIICGLILVFHRGRSFSLGAPHEMKLNGFPPGPVYLGQIENSKSSVIQIDIIPGTPFEVCKPPSITDLSKTRQTFYP